MDARREGDLVNHQERTEQELRRASQPQTSAVALSEVARTLAALADAVEDGILERIEDRLDAQGPVPDPAPLVAVVDPARGVVAWIDADGRRFDLTEPGDALYSDESGLAPLVGVFVPEVDAFEVPFLGAIDIRPADPTQTISTGILVEPGTYRLVQVTDERPEGDQP
jgi:hypothetical protein